MKRFFSVLLFLALVSLAYEPPGVSALTVDDNWNYAFAAHFAGLDAVLVDIAVLPGSLTIPFNVGICVPAFAPAPEVAGPRIAKPVAQGHGLPQLHFGASDMNGPLGLSPYNGSPLPGG